MNLLARKETGMSKAAKLVGAALDPRIKLAE
jgi:hypothetical protein